METDEEDSRDLFPPVFNSVVNDLVPSPHTLKQRRWRRNRKEKPYSSRLPLSLQTVEQTNERPLSPSPDNDISEVDLIMNDDISEVDSIMNDDNAEADLIIVDDDLDLSLNSSLTQSNERFLEEELDELLYERAPVSFKSYHKQILEFGNLVKLNDSNMNKLLKLTGNALPTGNKLVKSYRKLVSIFQKESSFHEILRCTQCFEIINNNSNCSIVCARNGSQRRVGDMIEHVSIDRSNRQLIEIIRRNKHLILDYPRFVDKLLPCDVMTRSVYAKKKQDLQATFNDTFSITLMLHIDSTPIVHWSKKHTWLVTASIVEIPPPLRENQFNLLLLTLWNAPIKPDADLLLKEICDSIKQTLVVDGVKFSVDVLLFKADLPARALATKHVHHNAYYACLECDQEGVWCEEGRIVIYPYSNTSINLRTPAHIDICAQLTSGQSAIDHCYGVKGVSPLSKILDIPTQIDLDVMHLCFIGHCSLLLSKWEKLIVKEAWLSDKIIMYNSSSFNNNNNNENLEPQVSQEYSSPSYYEMQPVSFVSVPQSPVYIHRQDSSSPHIRDPRFNDQRSGNQPVTSILDPTTIDNQCVAPVTSTGLPAKKRRAGIDTLAAPSTAPLPRKRFDPVLQSTASSMMNNHGGGNTIGTKAAVSATKSISETTQNGFNQIIKPLIKLCEETNQLMKELLKQTTDQTRLINELVHFPRDLQKSTHQLSQIVHMQAKVLQTQQHNDDEDLVMELNGIDLSHVSRGASLNATARALVRSAYGETASFVNLAPGEFEMLLGFLARIHGMHTATIFANSPAIKNSLQQMKHDMNKRSSSIKSSTTLSQRRTSTAIEQPPHDDDDDIDEV